MIENIENLTNDQFMDLYTEIRCELAIANAKMQEISIEYQRRSKECQKQK